MIADLDLVAARADVALARARLIASAEEAKQRLSPRALASEAVDGVKAKAGHLASEGVEAVRQRPFATAALVTAIGLFLARKPIIRAVGRIVDDDDATGETPAS